MILHHPDAVVPADHGVSADGRALALAVRGLRLIWTPQEAAFAPRHRPALRVPHLDLLGEMVRGCTGLTPADLVGQLESLGHDCEFGLFQRMVGAEPLGLLRFGGIAPENLLAGLECAFDGIDDPAQIALLRANNAGQEQYVVRSERYGLAFHSFIPTAGVPEAAMRARMAAHLRFLRRKFAETLLSGESLFVLHHPAGALPPQVRPYLAALRSWGPNALLFVTVDQAPEGSVNNTGSFLLHGHIDRWMSDTTLHINAPAWLSLCTNGYRLWREGGWW